MHIIQPDSQENKRTKYSVVFQRTNRYPKPGEFILISSEDIDGIVSSANAVLIQNETFLQTAITTSSEQYYVSRQLFPPCAAEHNSLNKFYSVLRVEQIHQKQNKIYVETNNPFLNLPKDLTLLFDANHAVVVDLKLAKEMPTRITESDEVIPSTTSAYYTNKDGQRVVYNYIVDMPKKLADWVSMNLVKEFSLVFDFSGEVETLLQKQSPAGALQEQSEKIKSAYNHEVVFESAINTQSKQVEQPKRVDDAQHSTMQFIDDSFVEMHPLYDYTCAITTNVFEQIRKTCNIRLEDQAIIAIMKNIFNDMLKTTIDIVPPSENE